MKLLIHDSSSFEKYRKIYKLQLIKNSDIEDQK